MPDTRTLVHTVFVMSLPLIVAGFGLSFAAALVLVLLALLGRWLIVLTGLVRPVSEPALVLETISASHFVEKVRWCMDRLGIDYAEEPWGGTLGAYYLGRTVPKLKFRTGRVRSTLGNSAEILRYLWGAYSGKLGDVASFLAPTPDRLEFERRLDRYGVNLQVWLYYHLLDHRELTLQLWGVNDPRVPRWQRKLVSLLCPLQSFLIRRSFSINEQSYAKACHHIEELLAHVDTELADGRPSILGDGAIDYVDIAFAAMSGVWLQPAGYGGGRADAVRLERDRVPVRMRKDIDRWVEDYPRATAFTERLYADERRVAPASELRNLGDAPGAKS